MAQSEKSISKQNIKAIATKGKTKKSTMKAVRSIDLSNVLYLDPKVDLTFRRIFGEHPDLLIDFLNAVMPLPPDRLIVSVEYLPSELMPDDPNKKYSIVDVRCKDNHKRQFIIEMQVLWTSEFYNRIVFNAGKAYVKQLEQGDKYELLQPVYTLALINENFDLKTKKFYHHYQIVNPHNIKEIIPGLEFVLVELTDKFCPAAITSSIGKSKVGAMRKLMVLWLRFLKETNEKMTELPTNMKKNAKISKAAELCKRAAYTPEELLQYNAYKEYIRLERALRDGARKEGKAEGEAIGLEKGFEKGEAIGMEKGLEMGEAIGMEKGLEKGEAIGMEKSYQKMIENANKAGFSIETMETITGLSHHEIEKILKNLNNENI
ncbi:MAG: Rpn family recombination-promoting nuclease/putative transposase [Marinilabiliaceae bacterium]|nr:Rpn family recombination-promoting nuclease/putative transposase [Marinilabiliaceae bacterium]